MENGPDSHADATADGGAVTEHTGPATDRVRIVGAETAADITSELPAVHAATAHRDDVPAASTGSGDDAEPGPEAEASAPVATEPVATEPVATEPVATELPHWTEPPTGQVPAVLARDDDTAAESAIEAPTWREDDSDWRAAEEGFEPAMFGDDQDEVALGALDESAAADEERRPWEFDLDGEAGLDAPEETGPATAPVPVVGREEPDGTPGGSGTAGDALEAPDADSSGLAVGAAGAAAGAAVVGAAIDGGDAGGDRPSGVVRPGRIRRSSLRAGGLRAKRPADEPGAVDADDLPGASVADVPGAGRRRSDVASLAASDRTAERAGAPGDDDGEHSDAPLGLRARLARRGADRPLRTSSNYEPEATGGGPPTPTGEQRPERPEPASSTGLRIGTGVAVGVVALVAFNLGTVTALLLALVVVTCAAGEVFAVLRRAGWRPATLLGLVGTISLMVGAYTKGIAALPLVMVLIVAFTLLWYLFGVERGSAVAGTASTLLVVGWVSLFGSFAGLLLAPSTFPHRHGIAFLLGAIIATVANDVGALVVGRWIGTRPLYPSVSPNKTWEGLAGGALASILVSTVVVGIISPWSPSSAALLGVVVAVVAPLGDLSESLLKRDLRLKDMGTLLPGHGGVLDRVDALIFVLPATYYLVRALNIG